MLGTGAEGRRQLLFIGLLRSPGGCFAGPWPVLGPIESPGTKLDLPTAIIVLPARAQSKATGLQERTLTVLARIDRHPRGNSNSLRASSYFSMTCYSTFKPIRIVMNWSKPVAAPSYSTHSSTDVRRPGGLVLKARGCNANMVGTAMAIPEPASHHPSGTNICDSLCLSGEISIRLKIAKTESVIGIDSPMGISLFVYLSSCQYRHRLYICGLQLSAGVLP